MNRPIYMYCRTVQQHLSQEKALMFVLFELSHPGISLELSELLLTKDPRCV